MSAHSSWVNSCTFSGDGSLLVTASSDTSVCVWDMATFRRRHVLTGHRSNVWACVRSSNGTTMATCSSDNKAMLWDVETGDHLATVAGHSSWVYRAAFNASGSVLATGSWDGSIRLFRLPVQLHAHAAFLTGILAAVVAGRRRHRRGGHPQLPPELWGYLFDEFVLSLHRPPGRKAERSDAR